MSLRNYVEPSRMSLALPEGPCLPVYTSKTGRDSTVQILVRPHTLPSRPKNFTLSSLKGAHDLESKGGSSRKAKWAN
ncbi:hypothetical protein FRC12_018688, partial [Ceratobasidium sp. 428]